MKTADEWVDEISKDIERLKLNGRKYHYLISVKMSHPTSEKVKNHFTSLGYSVEMKECSNCKKTFDFIFEWNL